MDSAEQDKCNFTEMWKSVTKHQLKKELKQLKIERNPSVSKIIFVSRMLCAEAALSPTNKVDSVDNDLELKNMLNTNWSFVKHYLVKAVKVLPTFDKPTCYEFF